MSAHIVSKDHGANAMVQAALKMAKGTELKVGILASGKANDTHDGVTVGEIAAANEFGTARIPERSFIRAWYDGRITENRKALRALSARVLRGELTQEQAWEQLGLLFQADIQKRMAEGVPPPNAPATIAAKGSSTPLIDSGQLRSSVTYEVG